MKKTHRQIYEKMHVRVTSLFYRKLKAISDIQDTLNHFDVITSVIEHLNCPQDDVVRETLAFLCMLLYNGNENVQVLLIHKCWPRLIAALIN